MEPEDVHDDITQQLVDSVGLDCAIMALSRICDRSARSAERDGQECLAFVYRSLAHDLWRVCSLMRSGELIDRFRSTEGARHANR